MSMNKKAIILFSGGLDSTTCLAIAKDQGYSCYALSFAYGQKHQIELEQAKKTAGLYGVAEHRILTLPIGEYGGSSLTDNSLEIPDHQDSSTIPNTYVPARNTIFLAFAFSWGEVIGAYDIFYGANCVDYSHYPDCRPEYMRAMESVAELATKAGVEDGIRFRIHTPLLHWNKAEIIRQGLRLGVQYGDTISCYRADKQGRACGTCDSCTHRIKGFSEAGVADPTIYV